MSIGNKFCFACKTGNLEEAKKILSINPNIDILANHELAFLGACQNGYLEVAQWLLSVKPNIDISAYNENAFRYACIRGHLKVAQWLLTVKPSIDISAKEEFAFCLACRYGRLEIAQWLQSLKPYLYVIKNIKNKEIKYYIRTKKESKWENIKYGLWLQNVNTNIIGALPIDISKTVLAYF